MKTFNQQVEEIFQKHGGICNKCYGGANCPYGDDLDKCPLYQAILTAHNAELGRIAAGASEVKNHIDYMTRPVENNAFSYGACKQLEKDRAYIQAQKGS
jgi:hypothetical protein